MRKALLISAAVVCFLVVSLAVPSTAPQSAPQTAPTTPSAFPASKIHEELIGEISPENEFGAAVSTENHVAWIEKAAGKKIVRLDGKQVGGSYDDVKYVHFSHDEQHLTFLVKRKSNWLLVLDGQERTPEFGRMTAPALSPNGRFFAAGACREKKCRLIVNGEEMGPEFEEIGGLGFSREGEHYVYFGKAHKKWVMLLDGKQVGPEMDDFEAWRFAPDGTRVAVAALMKGYWTWIVDGVPGPPFDVISDISFRDDAKHYAYGGTGANWGFSKHKTSGAIVVDGKVIASYEGKGFGGGWQGIFGQSSQIATGMKFLWPDFHGVSIPQYTSLGALVYAARRGEGDVVVFLDGVPGPAFDDIPGPIAVTPDAKHIAYIGQRGESFVEVRDNKPGATFPGKRAVSFVEEMAISKDGSHLAYEIVRGGRMFKEGRTSRALRRIVMDGQGGPEYDAYDLNNFEFTADGRHYFYEILGAEGDRDRVIFDALEGKLYDAVFRNSTRFIDEQTVEFVARDGKRFLRVTESLE